MLKLWLLKVKATGRLKGQPLPVQWHKICFLTSLNVSTPLSSNFSVALMSYNLSFVKWSPDSDMKQEAGLQQVTPRAHERYEKRRERAGPADWFNFPKAQHRHHSCISVQREGFNKHRATLSWVSLFCYFSINLIYLYFTSVLKASLEALFQLSPMSQIKISHPHHTYVLTLAHWKVPGKKERMKVKWTWKLSTF